MRNAEASEEAEKLEQEFHKLLDSQKYSEAIVPGKKIVELKQQGFGQKSTETAQAINELATVYERIGDYASAEPLFKRALSIYEKGSSANSAQTALVLNNLGVLYAELKKFPEAEPLYERALKIREKVLGPEHAATVFTLECLARLEEGMGNYTKAAPLYQRSLESYEKKPDPHPREIVNRLTNIAALYRLIGDYGKVESLYQRALEVYTKAYGPDHPDTAYTVEALGQLYFYLGDYAKAELFYERALKIKEKALGPEHPDTLLTLNNLAVLYEEIGDYEKAEPLYQRAIQIKEDALGPENPRTATSIDNLAHLYMRMGSYAKAEPLSQQALQIREKMLGPEHPATAETLNNLALLYTRMGEYAKARPLYERALKIEGKERGSEDPGTATTLNNLASLHRNLREFAEAEPLLRRALKIDEKILGAEHKDTANLLANLAWLYCDMGNQKEALRLAVQAQHIEEKTLLNILSFTSEQQRLAFQKTQQPYNFFGTLGRASELAQTVLRRKGVVLDSLLEDRLVAQASEDPKQREVLGELRGTKERLMQLQLETPKDLSEEALKKRDAEKNELADKVRKLEAQLARQVAGLGRARRALTVTVPEVQAALSKDEALIELLLYNHYLGNNKWEWRYGAIIIASSGEPKWVPLRSEKALNESVDTYQKSVRGMTDETTLSNVARELYAQIWAPIEKALPVETKKVVISPDVALDFVSFATLIAPDDKFLGEKYSVRYVASGRDLLRQPEAAVNPGAAVFANPNFSSKSSLVNSSHLTAVAMRSVEMRDLQSISLPPLPGTEVEAVALQKLLGSSAKIFLGADATKAQLEGVDSPRILHLATHGFFLPEIDVNQSTDPLQSEQNIPKGKLVNPMHRSGLALAGAHTTLEAWARGEVPPTQNDGIETAEDVGGLNLDGTWLVVLSACDTGVGEAHAGEGVMGLRRGFVEAGAQNLLMTLWPISDQTTVQMMLDFYDEAEKTHNAPQALADVQRDWLVKLRKERGLLAAVRLAGAFIMSSQAKP